MRNGPCPPPDHCPNDPAKLEPGICGCGVADVDTDNDGALDCVDPCPQDAPNDSDADGVCDGVDQCAGFDDRIDVDQNGIPDGCQECVLAAHCDDDNACTADGCTGSQCQHDVQAGASCGVNGRCTATAECVELPPDHCPDDPNKLDSGICGCGVADTDTDDDGAADCADPCPFDAQNDSDGDGVCNNADQCAGSDDRVDADHNGIPDGCQDCLLSADCDDGNACTSDVCDQTHCTHTPQTGASCGEHGNCSATAECVEPRCRFIPLGHGDTTATQPEGEAMAVSNDGTTVTGRYGQHGAFRAFRWRESTGIVGLDPRTRWGMTISADGSKIAGGVSTSISSFREHNGELSARGLL